MSSLTNYTPESVVSEDIAKHVFRVLHGVFGNLFLSRFATGQVEDGEDAGVKNARRMWAFGLRDYHVVTVKAALARVLDTGGEYPPTLPQLRALCAAISPRQASVPAVDMAPAQPSSDVRADVDRLLQGTTGEPNKQWAHRLRARHDAGERLKRNQIRCYKNALGLHAGGRAE